MITFNIEQISSQEEAGQEGEYQAAYARDVNIDDLIWRNNKYIIPLRLLHHFFAVPLEMDVSLNLKFDLETNMSKRFEFIGNVANANGREDIDTTAPDIQVTLFKTPTIKYFLYEHIPAEAARKNFILSQMKAFRTSIQPVYHEKLIIINAAGFGGHLNFNNTGTQFEWIIISIQTEISTEHRNLHTTYGNEQANHLIKKIEISNIRRKYSRINEKIYDLDNFDNQLELFDQFRSYISNMASTKNALDFSLIKECQQAAQ